jgi:hypothetical protein
MTPEDFFEQMRQILSQSEGIEPLVNASTAQNIIAKPRKNYVSSRDILNIFNINKDIYNNLLVRTGI